MIVEKVIGKIADIVAKLVEISSKRRELHLRRLKVGTGTIAAGNNYWHISGTTPYIRFEGTELNGADKSVREYEGTMKVWDHTSDSEVMDIESHASRHIYGGDDEVVGVLIQDTAANRPAAGVENRFFLATDTMELSRDNGTSWDTIGVLGGLDLTAHASRHAYGGDDAIGTDDLRYSQVLVEFGTESSVSVGAGSTSTIDEGAYIARCGPNTKVEYSPDNGTTWYDLLGVGEIGYVFSDGSNVRFNNTGGSAEDSYLLPLI